MLKSQYQRTKKVVAGRPLVGSQVVPSIVDLMIAGF